jgi:protein-disulfide isomerase
MGLALACLVGFSTHVVAQTAPRLKVQTKTAATPQASFPNWAMGAATAPVTLIEYGSLTCGHCAEFNNDIMPTVKRLYIDTGCVRYILRPLPTPPFELSVALHALTLCAGPTRYYPLADAYFQRQREIFEAAGGETGPKGIIFAIAQDVGGLNYAASEACLRQPLRQQQVLASANAGAAAGVTGTPTLFVNGTLVPVPAGQHHHELADVTRALDAALAAAARAPQGKAKAKAKKAKKR